MKLTKNKFLDKFMIDKYGDYQLGGIRPYGEFVPKQGFKHGSYEGMPAVIAAVSKESILDIFYMMLDEISGEVIVVLESSHNSPQVANENEIEPDYFETVMDLVVLKSILIDYEDFMLEDGLFGISVYNYGEEDNSPIEVQLDEHSLLIGYSEKVEKFNQILEMHGLVCDEELELIIDNDHVHLSGPNFYEKFLSLKIELGVE